MLKKAHTNNQNNKSFSDETIQAFINGINMYFNLNSFEKIAKNPKIYLDEKLSKDEFQLFNYSLNRFWTNWIGASIALFIITGILAIPLSDYVSELFTLTFVIVPIYMAIRSIFLIKNWFKALGIIKQLKENVRKGRQYNKYAEFGEKFI